MVLAAPVLAAQVVLVVLAKRPTPISHAQLE